MSPTCGHPSVWLGVAHKSVALSSDTSTGVTCSSLSQNHSARGARDSAFQSCGPTSSCPVLSGSSARRVWGEALRRNLRKWVQGRREQRLLIIINTFAACERERLGCGWAFHPSWLLKDKAANHDMYVNVTDVSYPRMALVDLCGCMEGGNGEGVGSSCDQSKDYHRTAIFAKIITDLTWCRLKFFEFL